MVALSSSKLSMVWQQTNGAFKPISGPQRIVKVGVPGMPDVCSVQRIKITQEMVGKDIGVFVGYEMKTEKGRQTEIQKAWQKAIEKVGGVYFICRSEEEAKANQESVQEVILNR